MKNKEFYGFEGYYNNNLLDFLLPVITESETSSFRKKKETDGIPVYKTENTVLTVFKKDPKGKRTTVNVDITSACEYGSPVALYIVLSPVPMLFAYTNEMHKGLFPLERLP